MRGSARVAALAAVLLPTAAARADGWRADPALVERLERDGSEFVWDEAKVPAYTLPDPLLCDDGSHVRGLQDWPRRRQELLKRFRSEVYGRRPGPPDRLDFEVVEDDPAAMAGAATLRRVAITSRHGGREHRFTLTLFLPNGRPAPAPVFLLINNRGAEVADPTRRERSGFWPAEEVVARGCGVAAIQAGELAPDDADTFRDGVIRLFEGPAAAAPAAARPPDACGALAAWGWGASRALDYFETDPAVDATKIALLGHSRGGKAALWAGAEDERFALVISNDSGCGGAALSRRRFGETVARINASFPHWFCGNFKTYDGREDDLPVDQHELVALIAPRPVYVASADRDLWADPRGEYLSLAHASPVYALWGFPAVDPERMPAVGEPLATGPRGYHVRAGEHDLTPEDWTRYLDFADTVWRPADPPPGAPGN